MSDFKAKMHQIVCRLGLRPRPRWGSLQRSPRPSSWILGSLLLRGEGTRGEEREGESRVGEMKGGEEREKGSWGTGRKGMGAGEGRIGFQAKVCPPQNYFPGAGAAQQ